MTIYEVLKKDHDNLKELLNELVMIGADDEETRHELIKQIRDEIVPHSRAEETVLYNSMRMIDSAKDVVMHGYQEHMEAEALLRTLQVKDKVDLDWQETAKKLKKALEHHIEEEEGKIFGVARQLFTQEEAAMMAEAFEQLKPEVKTEGFMKTTLDLITNLMPPRFAASLRTYDLDSRL